MKCLPQESIKTIISDTDSLTIVVSVLGERLNISLARCLEFLLRLKKILIEGPAKPYQNSEEI